MTNSLLDAPPATTGNQRPTFERVPDAVDSDAEDAIFLSSQYGLTADPWQAHLTTGVLGRRPDGLWAATRVGVSLPRQNGKTGWLEILELFKMVILGRHILHTAHEVKTVQKHFMRMCAYFENPSLWPELADLVAKIVKTNGMEAIHLTNGGSLEVIARSKKSGRGYTEDDLVCDEAQHLTDEEQEALWPVVSAAPSHNPQIILTGTPPLVHGEGAAFARFRKAAQKGTDDRLAWFEWGIPAGSEISDDNVVHLIVLTNPGIGIRLELQTALDERGGLSPAGFARERLGQWPTDTGTKAIDPELWATLALPQAVEGGVPSFGVDMPPDRSAIAIGGCRRYEDGHAHVELVEFQPATAGYGWAVDWLVERWPRTAAVVIDRQSPAMALLPDLIERHVKVITTGAGDLGAACGRFVDMLGAAELTHRAGQEPFELAVTGATRRQIGRSGAFAWAPADKDVNIAPLMAATLALHGAFVSKRHPGRKSRMVRLA